MAYADQEMSGNRIIALIIVALIHIAVGYVLVTGLAYEAVKKAVERVTTVDIDEPEPEPEEPPPPEEIPESSPPPIVAPPPPINIAPAPPPVRTQPTIPPPAPIAVRVPPPAPPAPPPPPPPAFQPKDPTPRGNPGSWASPRDYPSRALREEREGVTRFRVTVNADGRVTNCQITGSSGHSDLDETTCKLITRRGRFRPATDGNGQETTGTWSNAVRWQIPE
ncbi:TonB family protein [Altererythrobacter luteolus]|uniref:TonB family protein n=2 Tax=Pontixanthobacter luteolus TaxID=295089 RepID=A0A6I4V2N2_9SPHN|nr:energy transducer TonB [Pontixanthobacter luteolus]MXP48028.1 TonB family protein [Pontixanthobacter luteolus]